MANWKRINDYYAISGNWTLTSTGKKELGNQKFGLFEGLEFRGVSDTPKEAVEMHKKMIEGKK